MFNFFKKTVSKLVGSKQEKDLKLYEPRVLEINEAYAKLNNISDDALRQKTASFREQIAEYLADIDNEIASIKEQTDSEQDLNVTEQLFNEIDELKSQRDEKLEEILYQILPEAFAVVKETARRFSDSPQITVQATDLDRSLAANKEYITIDGDTATYQNSWQAAGGDITWNMVHYDVQLIGGMALHDGKIAEMQTGEGKTLVATLPAYLNGLAGLGVHVVTVNNYLAQRDAEWIGPIMEFLGLTISCIDKFRPHSPERKKAYQCDIVYGTNNEFGFDYLRDNMVISPDDLVQGKKHYAMIDEVDSVLIDEARTPLIISGPISKDPEDQEYVELKPFVERLIQEQRKIVTDNLALAKKHYQEGELGNEEGHFGMEILRAFRGLPKYRPLIKFLSEEGVKVNLQKAENFYMQEQSKRMHLVDEKLLFTIEEKTRSVELTDLGVETLSKMVRNDKDFFIMPDITKEIMQVDDRDDLNDEEKTETKEKIAQDYAVKSKRIHSINQLLKAYALFEKDEDYVVMDDAVKIVDEQTGRMMEGRRYSDGLHQALEAKENVKVGDITQTYATVTLQNYFRMYHKLAGMTGTAETEASELWEIYKLDVVVIPTNRPIARADNEDMVFKTQREKFNAVLDEIEKLTKAGRPVLVGTTSVDVSEKLSRMLQLKGVEHNVLNAKQHQREAEIVAEAGLPSKVTIATNMAGRGTDIKITPKVKEDGGLAIIGTERHDSRRVDRQLRGRSGRQGDPGSTHFFVSLEDPLMRRFGSERIAGLMDRMGHQEGEVIQHSMVTNSIERAQKKVEENSFGVRKRLLEYDDVMNIQREAIYLKRHHALFGDRLSVDIHNMMEGLTAAYFEGFAGQYERFKLESLKTFGVETKISEEQYATQAPDILEMYREEMWNHYNAKSQRIKSALLPWITDIKAEHEDRYRRVSIPYTDGRTHPLPVSVDINRAIDSKGQSIMRDIEKVIALAIIDDKWKEHLRNMDELKDSVQGASFEQKDPLVIYKVEAYNLFEGLISEINHSVINYLMKGGIPAMEQTAVTEAPARKRQLPQTRTNQQATATQAAARRASEQAGRGRAPKQQTVINERKVGRNEPCPCGSGKKYKQCHGR